MSGLDLLIPVLFRFVVTGLEEIRRDLIVDGYSYRSETSDTED